MTTIDVAPLFNSNSNFEAPLPECHHVYVSESVEGKKARLVWLLCGSILVQITLPRVSTAARFGEASWRVGPVAPARATESGTWRTLGGSRWREVRFSRGILRVCPRGRRRGAGGEP